MNGVQNANGIVCFCAPCFSYVVFLLWLSLQFHRDGELTACEECQILSGGTRCELKWWYFPTNSMVEPFTNFSCGLGSFALLLLEVQAVETQKCSLGILCDFIVMLQEISVIFRVGQVLLLQGHHHC